MNLQELKAWAQSRYQEETKWAAESRSSHLRLEAVTAAKTFLEVVEKIEEGEKDE